MNIIKEIGGRIFAFWALIVFIVTLSIAFFPTWLIRRIYKDPKRNIYAFKVFRLWLTSFFILSGVRRKIVGKEHFKKGETYIVLCNHRSLLDPPLSCPAIPGTNKTIAKIEMAKIPIFSTIYKTGSVLVDRKNEESRRQSYARMKDVLKMNFHMCIYPEGTRNKTSQPLQRFHDGGFKLAVETGRPVIPSLIFKTDKVLPRKTFFFWPGKVEMHFLPAISSENKTLQELKEEVTVVMKNYYLQHQ